MPVCGNRARHAEGTPVAHASVAAIRACFLEEEVWPCSWLVGIRNAEDGESIYIECGGLTWFLPDNRGYACENGHDHIYDHVRADEGWDYAADPQEAGLLAGRGVRPVAMTGGPIDIDHGAFRYAAALPG